MLNDKYGSQIHHSSFFIDHSINNRQNKKNNFDMKYSYLYSFAILLVLLAWMPTEMTAQVTYRLTYDAGNQHYTVAAKSETAYTGMLSRLTGSTQISVVFPHVAGGYQIDSLTNLQGGATPLSWGVNRLDEPTENPNADYLFFSPNNAGNYTVFDFPAETYVDLFSFYAASGCVGNVALFDNEIDPLNSNNSLNTDNNFIVLGGGLTNQYDGNNNGSASCMGITYCLEFDNDLEAFVVSIESDVAYSGTQARLSPATQISIVAEAEVSGYQVTDLTGLQTGSTALTWMVNQINAPAENTDADYLFFAPANATGYTPFDIPANTKIPLFSFKSGGACSDLVIFDNEADALNSNVSLNPDNNITVLGAGQGNQYIGDTCGEACCCAADAPALSKN
jgi:hypothetical protein